MAAVGISCRRYTAALRRLRPSGKDSTLPIFLYIFLYLARMSGPADTRLLAPLLSACPRLFATQQVGAAPESATTVNGEGPRFLNRQPLFRRVS